MGKVSYLYCPEMLLRVRAIFNLGKSWREAPWDTGQHVTALPAHKHRIGRTAMCNVKIIQSPPNAVHVMEC